MKVSVILKYCLFFVILIGRKPVFLRYLIKGQGITELYIIGI
jgi:hypothetical protein